MNWIAWIVLGGVSGWIASLLTKRNARMGLLANIVTGVIGAFVGGFIMDFFGKQGVTGLNLWSILVAVVGATVLLVIINLIQGK